MQQLSFFAFVQIYVESNGSKNRFVLINGIAKLTGRILTVWLWNFLVYYLLCNFFLRIMSFQPSFLLLHPPLLEVEPQRQKQQLNPHILLSRREKSAEAEIILYEAKSTLYLDGSIHSQLDPRSLVMLFKDCCRFSQKVSCIMTSFGAFTYCFRQHFPLCGQF